MSKNRKNYTPEKKVDILKKHLVEKDQVSDLCDKHDIHPNVFYRWQKVLFENGAMAFKSKKSKKATSRLEIENEELRKKLANKNEVIAELMEEHVKLKKNFGEI